MTKDEIIAQCIVPTKMRNDKYEPVTQEEFIEGLKAGVKQLGLSITELEEIRDGKASIVELRAIVNMRHTR